MKEEATYTNYHWVDDRLAVGGLVRETEDLPFDAILSLETFAPVGIRELIRSGPVDYRWLPIVDCYPYPGDEVVRSFELAALQLDRWLRDGKRVLVHCYSGVSRGGTAAVWYLMRRDDLTWDEALARVKARRRAVYPDIRFELPLRLANGEVPDDHWIDERLAAWCDEQERLTGVPFDPEPVREELEREGIIARAPFPRSVTRT